MGENITASRDREVIKRQYSNRNNFIAKNRLDIGDSIIDLDGRVNGYGEGIIENIYSYDLFSVKFPDMKFLVMFTADGCRWDRTTSEDGVKKERAMPKYGDVPKWYTLKNTIKERINNV